MIISPCPERKYEFFTVPEFRAAQFPPSSPEADMFTGAGVVDVVFIKPNPQRTGKLLLIIPSNAAALLQKSELQHLRPDLATFCVAPADTLDNETLDEIVNVAPDLNGLYVDLMVCTPEHRKQIRSLPVKSVNVNHVLRAAKAGRN